MLVRITAGSDSGESDTPDTGGKEYKYAISGFTTDTGKIANGNYYLLSVENVGYVNNNMGTLCLNISETNSNSKKMFKHETNNVLLVWYTGLNCYILGSYVGDFVQGVEIHMLAEVQEKENGDYVGTHFPNDGSPGLITVEKYQNDKTYSYTLTKAPKGYEDAIGDYYSATPEEMMELYPQITSYEGGTYYTNGEGWMLCLSEGINEWCIYKYYPDYEGGDYWKWDNMGMCSSSTLPDTGNWTGGYDVVVYS